MQKLVSFLLFTSILLTAQAQSEAEKDSLNQTEIIPKNLYSTSTIDELSDSQAQPSFFSNKKWVNNKSVVPAILLTSSFCVWGKRKNARDLRNRYMPDHENHLDDYVQYAPAVATLALSVAGKKGRNKPLRQVLNVGTSSIIMAAFVNSIKYTAKVVRPDQSTANSFPSGHTATAFMSATFLHKEYGHISPIYSVLGYTSSSYFGASRSLNNRHWISDILAGAAIGIVSTELGYLIVDHFYKNKGDYFTGFTIQDEIRTPSYLSARMGYSFDIKSGKELGFESAIEGAFYLNKHWGIAGEVTFGHYFLDSEEWKYGNFELSDAIIKPSSQCFQSMGMFYLMAGPQYSKTLGSKFIIQSKLTLGLTLGTTSEMSLVGLAEDKDTGIERPINLPFAEYKLRSGIATGLGMGITAMMTPKVGLTWFADYKHSKLTFDIDQSEEVLGNQINEMPQEESTSLNNISSGFRLTAFF